MPETKPPGQSRSVHPAAGADPGDDPFARGNRPTPAGPTILQVVPALDTGGVERGTLDIAAAITLGGGRALIASSGGRMVRDVPRTGARHLTLPLATKSPLGMRRNALAMADLIRAEGVTLVHARSRAPAWSARMAARSAGVPFMTTFHGTYGHSNALKRVYNSVMARGDRVIAISQHIAQHITSVYHTDPAVIRVIPRGIDTAVFHPDAVSADRVVHLAQAWRLREDRYTVLLPARLTRWKGALILLRAAAKLNRPDVQFILVGDAQGRLSFERELGREISALNLQEHVLIAGHCDDMAAAYKLSDVVVNPSIEPEAFGRVVVEAQAMGRPVIASTIGAPPETVLPEKTGWLVPPGDPDALATALDLALSLDASARAAWAERSIAHVAASFTKERMCARTLAVYAELSGHAPWAEAENRWCA